MIGFRFRFRFRPMRPSIETPFASVPMPCFFSSIFPRPASVSVSRARIRSIIHPSHPSVASIHPSIGRVVNGIVSGRLTDGRTGGRDRDRDATCLRTRPELAGRTRPIGTDDASLGERAGIHRFREEDSQTRTDANGRAVGGGVSRGGVSRGGVSRGGRRRERSNGYMLSISTRAHRPRTSLFSAFPHTPTRRSNDRSNEPVERTGRTDARRGERVRAKGAFGRRGRARHGPDAPTGVGGVATRRKV